MVKILHLPDLHIGSLWAPMSDELEIKDNLAGGKMHITPTYLQSYLYDNLMRIVKHNKWDLVICNGDIVDGPNPGAEGRNCWSADMAIQIDVAKQILEQIDCDKWVFTCGTLYHSVVDRPAEEQLASELRKEGKEAYYGYDFLLNIGIKKVHVAHCIDYKGNKYDALSKELGCRGADIVLRGHRHECGMISDGKRYAILGPCWQWRNEYGVTNGMYGGTDIGAQIIDIDGDRIGVDSQLVDMSHFKSQSLRLNFN